MTIVEKSLGEMINHKLMELEVIDKDTRALARKLQDMCESTSWSGLPGFQEGECSTLAARLEAQVSRRRQIIKAIQALREFDKMYGPKINKEVANVA